MKKRDYKPGDKISRQWAWEDFKDDFPRMWDALKNPKMWFDRRGPAHIYTDMFVNIWRMIGISDRDLSQWFGRVSAVLSIFIPIAAYLE